MVKAHLIYRVTPTGNIHRVSDLDKTMATFITGGPDGMLWFTEPNGKIGKLTTAGVVTNTYFPILTRTRPSNAETRARVCSVRRLLRYKRSIYKGTETVGAGLDSGIMPPREN